MIKPLISIIVPVYNVEAYLHDCLNSIVSWTFQNWEAILVDDGSTDKSGEICDEFVAVDSRFKVIHKHNEGVSVARNVGLDLAQGEYCWFVDSDDIIDSHTPVDLSRIKGKDIIFFDIKMFHDGEVIACTEEQTTYDACVDLNAFYQKYNSSLHQTLWYHRRFWNTKDGYAIRFTKGIRLGEDGEFMRKCEFLSTNPIKVNHTNYYYRLRAGSACRSGNQAKVFMEDAFVVMDNILSFIQQNSIQSAEWKTRRIATIAVSIVVNAINTRLWSRNVQRKFNNIVNQYERLGFRLTTTRYVWLATKLPQICALLTKLRAFMLR